MRSSYQSLVWVVLFLVFAGYKLACSPFEISSEPLEGWATLQEAGQGKSTEQPSDDLGERYSVDRVDPDVMFASERTERQPEDPLCSSVRCPLGAVPDPTQQCQCIASKGWCKPCKRDMECSRKGRCIVDALGVPFCVEDCSSSGQCSEPTSYACLPFQQQRLCLPLAGACPCLTTTCPKGQQCCMTDGLCHECCDDKDCTSPQVCRRGGTCGPLDHCAGKVCSSGQQCNAMTGQCECASPCPLGACCNAAMQQCLASACGNSEQCQPSCKGALVCCDVAGDAVCLPYCFRQYISCKQGSCSPGDVCCKLKDGRAWCVSFEASTVLDCLP